MKSLEAIGVLEKDDDKGGRRITQSGQRDLDRECYPHGYFWIMENRLLRGLLSWKTVGYWFWNIY